MTTEDGIIDIERNPFTRSSWVNQHYKFTPDRAEQMAPLLGCTVSKIKKMIDDNISNYPAFIGIRWGYAEIVNDKLVGTKKWELEKDELLK